MSDFPPGYSDLPPGSGGPPRSGDLFDPGLPPPGRDPAAIKARVRAPAIFLIVVGVINLLLALYQLASGVMILMKSPADIHKESVEITKTFVDFVIKDPDTAKKVMDQAENQDPKAQYNQALMEGFGSGIVFTILSLLVLFGGFRMMALRSYGLAVTGAIIAAIPIISCPGACCFIGEIAGIWALIVLLNGEVRSAFR